MKLPQLCRSCTHYDDEDGPTCCNPESDCYNEVKEGRLPTSFEHNYDDQDVAQKITGVCYGCGKHLTGHIYPGRRCSSCYSELKWGM